MKYPLNDFLLDASTLLTEYVRPSHILTHDPAFLTSKEASDFRCSHI